MMAAQFGTWTAQFLFLFFLSALVLFALKNRHTYQAVTIATFVGLGVAALFGGYGMSTEGTPTFALVFVGQTFANYLIPAFAVLLVHLIRVRRRVQEPGSE
jgi:hypothetical protein